MRMKRYRIPEIRLGASHRWMPMQHGKWVSLVRQFYGLLSEFGIPTEILP